VDILRNNMQTKKNDKTDVDSKVLNQGMIHVFTYEVLKKHDGEILEKYELLGQPLLLVFMSGKRSMVALNALYEDRPKHTEDKTIEAAYKEEIKVLAALNNAKPFMAYFAVSHKHKDMEPEEGDCRLCLQYKGTAPLK